MINKISDLTKILLGKKLSKREMELAKAGKKKIIPPCQTLGSSWKNIYSDGNLIVKVNATYTWKTTIDASNFRETHSMFYWDRVLTKTFNAEGLLIKKEIQTKKDYRTISYELLGNFIGKRISQG